jgi:hypothetical protein
VSQRLVIKQRLASTSVKEFIHTYGWSIAKKLFVVVGHEELPKDTPVRCDITLSTGTPIIRAEGVVVGYVQETDKRPGGPKIRVQRVTPDTQKFFTEVLKARTERRSLAPPPKPARSVPPPAAPNAPSVAGGLEPRAQDALRALRTRAISRLEAPANRDFLLQRLRERGRSRGVSG